MVSLQHHIHTRLHTDADIYAHPQIHERTHSHAHTHVQCQADSYTKAGMKKHRSPLLETAFVPDLP